MFQDHEGITLQDRSLKENEKSGKKKKKYRRESRKILKKRNVYEKVVIRGENRIRTHEEE